MKCFLRICGLFLAGGSVLWGQEQDGSGESVIPGQWLIWTTCPVSEIVRTFPASEYVHSERLTPTLSIYRISFLPVHPWFSLPVDSVRHLLKGAFQRVPASCRVIGVQPVHRVTLRRPILPNDSCFPDQWNLYSDGSALNIRAPEAWDSVWFRVPYLPGTQSPVVVAVIDAGFDTAHPDLVYQRNTAEIPLNQIDDDQNGYVDDYWGWNFRDTSPYLTPYLTHGTSVASLIGARANNRRELAGTGWNLPVYPVEGASVNEATVIQALAYILEFRRRWNRQQPGGMLIVAVNMSFGVDYGKPSDFPLWCALLDSLGKEGILSVGATMNAGVNVDSVGDIPSLCPSPYLVVVTSVDMYGNLRGAWGPASVDVAVPSWNIPVTPRAGWCPRVSGTSYAAPQVSAIIGSVYSVLCSMQVEKVRTAPDSVARWIRQLVTSSVIVLPTLQGRIVSGGVVDFARTVQRVLTCDTGVSLSADAEISSVDLMREYVRVRVYQDDGRFLQEWTGILGTLWWKVLFVHPAGSWVEIVPLNREEATPALIFRKTPDGNLLRWNSVPAPRR